MVCVCVCLWVCVCMYYYFYNCTILPSSSCKVQFLASGFNFHASGFWRLDDLDMECLASCTRCQPNSVVYFQKAILRFVIRWQHRVLPMPAIITTSIYKGDVFLLQYTHTSRWNNACQNIFAIITDADSHKLLRCPSQNINSTSAYFGKCNKPPLKYICIGMCTVTYCNNLARNNCGHSKLRDSCWRQQMAPSNSWTESSRRRIAYRHIAIVADHHLFLNT